MVNRSSSWKTALTLGLIVVAAVALSSQGRRGGRGGGEPAGGAQDVRSRMELMTDALQLKGDQRDAVRDRLDAAYKSAAPIRAELAKARAALATAAEATGGEGIGKAAEAYAEPATAMTELEMRTLAEVLALVTPEQKKQGTAAAFYLMRGMFLDDRRWNEMPKGRLY